MLAALASRATASARSRSSPLLHHRSVVLSRPSAPQFTSAAMAPGSAKRKSPFTAASPPPPTKKKTLSSTTKTAVATFFTPASQKPKDRTTWSERAPDHDTPASLLVAKYEPDGWIPDPGLKRRKVAAFDMDGTLITPASGRKFATEPADWKWWDPSVLPKLRALHDDGYQIVIFSNQAGLSLHPDPKAKSSNASSTRLPVFKQKSTAVLSALDLPTTVYAATDKDSFRKPRVGMWHEFLRDSDLQPSEVDHENSLFVGDAGGRIAVVGAAKGKKGVSKDFSCSDRNFAYNTGLRYLTPEEFFLGEKPRDFVREFNLDRYPCDQPEDDKAVFAKINDQDIVLFCGSPGAGKSTFYWRNLKPLGYERINQDVLGGRDKCVSVATTLLQNGESVAIDNTNANQETRALWVSLANKFNIPIRCVWFRTPVGTAKHNEAVRCGNKQLNPESRAGVPAVAFASFFSRFKVPELSEGFADITEVEFRFEGTKEEYAMWAKYWT